MTTFFPIQKAYIGLTEELKNCAGVVSTHIFKNPTNQVPYLLVKIKSSVWSFAIPDYFGGHKVFKELQSPKEMLEEKTKNNLAFLTNFKSFEMGEALENSFEPIEIFEHSKHPDLQEYHSNGNSLEILDTVDSYEKYID